MTATSKRNSHFALGILLVGLLLIFGPSLLRPAVTAEVLRAPEFDDISAFSDRDIEQVDAWLQEQVALGELPSVSVAIASDGKVVYQGAFGYADIKAGTKVTPDTSYHVASVTKAFTATLAVILHDRGVVDLDAPAVHYLPADVSISTDPERGATITLRQLASHTSGLPRGSPGPVQSVEGSYQLEPRRLYRHLASVRLEFDPGTDAAYSNLGFGLLGHTLERAAGKPYDQLLKQMICDPLRLERTTIQVNDKLRLATGYSAGIPRRPENHSYRERFAPSGGLIASAPDLARFLLAQMKPGVLSREALIQLQTPPQFPDGTPASRSLGWSVRSRMPIGPILEKNGGRNNCSAWIGFAPAHRVGVAVLTNCGGPDVDPIGYWLLERSVPGGPKLVTQYGYAKVAPWTGVRWETDRPMVLVRDRWSALVSIDGIPIEHIMEFAQKEFDGKARKRLAEDLVELLATMGHEPQWEVTLGLARRDGQVDQVPIRMTEDNRALVRE